MITFSLRMKKEDKEKIATLAKANKRSVNNEILIAIDKYLELDENYMILKEYENKGV